MIENSVKWWENNQPEYVKFTGYDDELVGVFMFYLYETAYVLFSDGSWGGYPPSKLTPATEAEYKAQISRFITFCREKVENNQNESANG